MRKFINRYDSIRGWIMERTFFANRRRKFLINFLSPLNTNNELKLQNLLKLSRNASPNFLVICLILTFIEIFVIFAIFVNPQYVFQFLKIYSPTLSLEIIPLFVLLLFILFYGKLFDKIGKGYLAQKWNVFILPPAILLLLLLIIFQTILPVVYLYLWLADFPSSTATTTLASTSTLIITSAGTVMPSSTATATPTPTTTPTPTSITTPTPIAVITATPTITSLPKSISPNNIRDEFIALTIIFSVNVLIYLSWSYLRTLRKHVVLPLTIRENKDNAVNLKAPADQFYNFFVGELREIGKLLNSTQVAETGSHPELEVSLIASSNHERDLNEQLKSLTVIETQGNKFPLGQILSFIQNWYSDTVVRGWVQRNEDSSLEIWVELSRKKGDPLSVGKAIVSESSPNYIDESQLKKAAQELAIRLVALLGQGAEFSSSWQGLQIFLEGRDAAQRHLWSHAIACYRQVTQLEESLRGTFGMGHFHLGAALILQGNLLEGMNHLKIAEASGPPTAENYYMLALATYYLNQNRLNKTIDDKEKGDISQQRLTHIENIERYARKALRLRNLFPELNHLLGLAFYQSGKIYKRETSEYQKEPNQESDKKSKKQFLIAEKHMRTAIEKYDKTLRSKQNQTNRSPINIVEATRLVKDRLGATSNLASILRSLGHYKEANQYHEDVRVIIPGDLRNLFAQIRSKCKAEEWNDAHKLTNKAWNIDYYGASADAHCYQGWALAGLIGKHGQNWLLQDVNTDEKKNLLLQVLRSLDFAVYLRPRFLLTWDQTDWAKTLFDIIPKDRYDKKNIDLILKSLEPLGYSLPYSAIYHLTLLWLTWRIDNAGLKDTFQHLPNWKDQVPFINTLIQNDKIQKLFNALQKYNGEIKDHLSSVDSRRIATGFKNLYQWVDISSRLYSIWKPFNDDDKNWGDCLFTLEDRLFIDIAGEFALRTCRSLAECGNYEHLYDVASESSNKLINWRKSWQNPGKTPFRFSPYVFRFQVATLLAWKAFAKIKKQSDPAFILLAGAKKDNYQPLADINDALKESPNHMLALYVKAIYLKESGLRKDAIEELSKIIRITETFEPNLHTASWETRRTRLESESLEETDPTRTLMYYYERVSGRQQFETFVSRTAIHTDLAKLFIQEGDFKAGKEHLLHALTWSPYNDLDAQNLILLARQLINEDQHAEALSVTTELRSLLSEIKEQEICVPLLRELEVLGCMALSRKGDHMSSINKANQLYQTWDNESSRSIMTIIENDASQWGKDSLESKWLQKHKEFLLKFLEMPNQDPTTGNKVSDHFKAILDKRLLSTQETTITSDLILQSKIIANHLKDLAEKLTAKYEIANRIVFNSAELRLNNLEIESDIAQERLELINEAIKEMGKINKLKNESQVLKAMSIAEYFDYAQLLDTQGWFLSNLGTDDDLKEAHLILLQAVEKNPNLAIANLHLAKTVFRIAQRAWIQRISNPPVTNDTELLKVSLLLREARHFLKQAQKLDTSARLASSSRRLNFQIESYLSRWDQIQLKTEFYKTSK